MEGLERLYRSMRSQGMDRAHFDFTYNGLRVDAVFVVDEDPFKLMLYRIGVVQVPVLPVERGYRIATFLGDNYSKLREVLGIDGTQDSRDWKPVDFLAHFDRNCVPTQVSPIDHECRPEHVAPRHREKKDIVEADKVHFCGIIDWTKLRAANELENKPSNENYLKTRALLGPDVAAFCKAHHISTKWTDNPADVERIRARRDIVTHIRGHADRPTSRPTSIS